MPAYGVYTPVPKKMVPVMHGMGVRRGPKVGYNTFQPRFRARPGRVISTRPMFTPLNATFQSKVVGYGIGGTRPTYHHEIRGGFVPPPPIYRSRPRSNSYNERQMEETEYQYNTSCVCTKCGKEF